MNIKRVALVIPIKDVIWGYAGVAWRLADDTEPVSN